MDFIAHLTHKTGIGPELAQEMVNHINYISVQKHINDQELIKLNQLIEQFYKQSQ